MPEQNTQHTMENLKEELAGLKSQLEKILKSAESKKTEVKDDIIDRLTQELEHLRKTATQQAHRIYESGTSGAEEVSEHVRKNPMASLLIAFGAGVVLSCIFRHLR